jgi:DNA-binding SARP family transcriptional activator
VDPPRSAAATLQLYISDLRRVLDCGHAEAGRAPGRHPVLPSRPAGYELSVQPGELDLYRFRALAAVGRDRITGGRCAEAAEAFADALALWRGPAALGDLGRADLAPSYTARLDEERLALLYDRIGTEICRGRGPAAVPELQELCARHPLREQFHEQLMLALCAAGRRAEALDVYARARRTLIHEVGIEPGPGLRAAQQAILDGRAPCDAAHRDCRRSGR